MISYVANRVLILGKHYAIADLDQLEHACSPLAE